MSLELSDWHQFVQLPALIMFRSQERLRLTLGTVHNDHCWSGDVAWSFLMCNVASKNNDKNIQAEAWMIVLTVSDDWYTLVAFYNCKLLLDLQHILIFVLYTACNCSKHSRCWWKYLTELHWKPVSNSWRCCGAEESNRYCALFVVKW